MKLAIPAYIYPDAADTLWPRILKVRPDLVVINPASGPGTEFKRDYGILLAKLRAANVKTYGYVSTRWAKNQTGKQLWESLLEADVYLRRYGITNCFFDEAATDPAQISYYRALNMGAESIEDTLINPGTFPDPAYLNIQAVKMVYECEFLDYINRPPPDWVYDDPRSCPAHYWHCVYGVRDETEAARVANLARERRAGYLWITKGVQPNPYNVLPPYFEKLPKILAEA